MKKRYIFKKLHWLPLILVLAITATTVTAATSPYVQDSFWMADPLFSGTPGDPTGAQPGDTVPGYWYRDTTNQNALAQYTEDQFTGELIELYNEGVRVQVYVNDDGANITLIDSDDYFLVVGCGGGIQQAFKAKDKLENTFGTKIVAGLIMTDITDEVIWGCRVWKGTFNRPFYASSSFDKAMSNKQMFQTENEARYQMFNGTFLPWGSDSLVGSGAMAEYRAVQPQKWYEPTVDISSPTEITFEGITLTLTPTFEEDAGLMVSIPEAGITILGDMFGHHLPNVDGNVSFQKIPPAEVIEFLNQLSAANPYILVFKSGLPVIGYDNVQAAITAQRDAMTYLIQEVQDKVGSGYTLDEIIATTHLSDALSDSPYNQEYASDEASIIRWIYTYYMGWFSEEPVELAETLTEAIEAQILADAYGGVEALAEAARQAELDASDQAGAEKALYLAYSAYKLSPDDIQIKQIYAQALRKIAFMQQSAYKRNYYLATAQEMTTVNTVPVVSVPLADVSADEDAADTTIDLTGVFTDADGDALTYTAESSNSSLVSAAVAGSILTLGYQENQNGAATVTVTAMDTFGDTAADDFGVTVNSVNDAPVVTAPVADMVVEEDAADSTIDLATIFSDVDIATNADTLSYTALSSNTSLVTATVSGATLTLDFQDNQSGSATITMTAADASGATVTDDFVVTVTPVNNAPVVAVPLADVVVDEDAPDATIDLTAVFMDIEADALTLTAVSSNPELVSAAVSGTILTLDFQNNKNGAATITVTAADPSSATVSDDFSVTVNPLNDAPWANGQEIIATAGIDKNFILDYGDIETAAENMIYTLVSGPSVGVLSGTAPAMTYTVDSGYTGDDSFTYKVTDLGDPDACTDVPCSPALTTETATVTIHVVQTSISGLVYNDANASGSLDEGEVGLEGVTIQLIPTDGSATIETVTGSDGSYTFATPVPGTYQVRQVLPEGYVQTTSDPEDITLEDDQSFSGIDFGVVYSADLKLDMTANLNYITIVYTFTVTNEGPAKATDVVLADTLPSRVSYISIITTQGYCTGLKNINCHIGTLASGNSATVTIKVLRIKKSAIVNSGSVTSDIFDIDMEDNSASATIP